MAPISLLESNYLTYVLVTQELLWILMHLATIIVINLYSFRHMRRVLVLLLVFVFHNILIFLEQENMSLLRGLTLKSQKGPAISEIESNKMDIAATMLAQTRKTKACLKTLLTNGRLLQVPVQRGCNQIH